MRGTSRSAACWTCKRRRLRCDARRPFCHRCQQADLRCDGYEASRKFINYTLDSRQSPSQTDQSSLDLCEAPRYEPRVVCSTTLSPLGVVSPQVSIAFLSANLFPGQLPGHRQPESSWILSAIRNDQSSMVLSTASCLAHIYFARIHGQVLSSEAVTNDYDKALRWMRSFVDEWSPNKAAFLFAGVICLMFFEMMRPTTLTAVKHHSDVVSTMIDRLGPETFSILPMHAHYLQARSIIIGRDLLHGTKCELAKKKWKTVPWGNGLVKTPHHVMWDLLADTCDLLADTSEILFGFSKSLRIHTTRTFLISTIRRLARWRWTWQERNGSAIYVADVTLAETFLPQHHKNTAPSMLPVFYQDADRCRDLMLYNTTALHLLHLANLWKLDTSVIFHEVCIDRGVWDQCPVSLPLPGLTASCIVSDIARSIDYHMIPNRLQCSLSFLPLAINAMHRSCLDYDTRQWLTSLTGRLVHVSGFEFFRMVCAGDADGRYLKQIEREFSAAGRLQQKEITEP